MHTFNCFLLLMLVLTQAQHLAWCSLHHIFQWYNIYTCICFLKLCWNVYISKYNCKCCCNICIHMCRLTIVAMPLGIIGLQVAFYMGLRHLSPLRILTGSWVIHVPNVSYLKWSFQILIFIYWGDLCISFHLYWALGDSPGKDPHWHVLSNFVPNLKYLQWPFKFL